MSDGVQARDDLGRAALYMMLTALFIPILNAAAKYLATRYPTIEIVWARYAGHFIYMIIVFAPRRGLNLLVANKPFLQIARSTLLCSSTAIFVSALPYAPLTTATAMSFTGPFIVTALSPLLLGERVGPARWAAVLAGFVGAMIVIRPGTEAMNAAGFLFILSATFSALYQILSRKLAAFDRAETSITYIALAGFILTSIPLPFIWVTPVSLMDAVILFSLGIFGGFGHYFLVRAFELAPAPFVSPFNYLNLIGATILSVLAFGQYPDVWLWIGASIIIGSGLFILFREHWLRKHAQQDGGS